METPHPTIARQALTLVLAVLCLGPLVRPALAASATAGHTQPPAVTLFRNVRIFDGKSSQLSAPSNVLVRGNMIERISSTAIPTDQGANTVLIDGGGRTLMPGLIDAHWHTMFIRGTPAELETNDIGYSNLLAAAEATATLLRGFTTVRDVGGPSFGLKRAIDEVSSLARASGRPGRSLRSPAGTATSASSINGHALSVGRCHRWR